MFQRKISWQAVRVAAAVGATALVTSSCISANDTGTTSVTPQGTVPLEKVRAGMPESIFKSARITFAVDTHPAASQGGKTQYISRVFTDKNGQYMAECRDDRCYELCALYNTPVDKEAGLASLALLLPADSPPESGVDDTIVKAPKDKDPRAIEIHYYGNKYTAVIIYSDKTATKISQINCYAMPPELAFRVDIPGLRAIKIPEYAKAGADVATGPDSKTTAEH
jgi:hypothetical protein